jgi:hypothetical protein
MIVETDQCDLDHLAETSLSGKCGIYDDACKELCNNISSSAVTCNARIDECFWLYNSNEGVEGAGSCKDKNDASVKCAWVMNGDQCNTGLKGTTLEDDCFWLWGDGSGLEGTCVEKVQCNTLLCNLVLLDIMMCDVK